MVDVTTSEAIAVELPANGTVRDTGSHDPGERLLALREAIERGDYRISASQLADAIVRARRRAN